MGRGIGTLSLDDQQRFADLYRSGAPRSEWRTAFPGVSDGVFNGRITKLNLHRPLKPERVTGLKADHPALTEGRTIFPGQVRSPTASPSVLMPGANSAKLGAVVSKGAWRGFPIYSLTLEERSTCPRSCHNWSTCYGSGMPWAWRVRHGIALDVALHRELGVLQARHPGGFAVRLHQLGDFPSVRYVERWTGW